MYHAFDLSIRTSPKEFVPPLPYPHNASQHSKRVVINSKFFLFNQLGGESHQQVGRSAQRPAMIRRRGPAPEQDGSSSSEGEDAFATLSRKNAKRAKPGEEDNQPSEGLMGDMRKEAPKQILPVSLTSSMKRHHKPSDTRKAKMDALLQELEAEKGRSPRDSHRFVPEKRGSFVDPSEEHLTTNIFVGNLAPSITEEALADLFKQFGETSIKLACVTSFCFGCVDLFVPCFSTTNLSKYQVTYIQLRSCGLGRQRSVVETETRVSRVDMVMRLVVLALGGLTGFGFQDLSVL